MFAKGRFLEATWIFDQFFRMASGPYLGSLAIFEVGMKFCVSHDWLWPAGSCDVCQS